MRLFARYVWQYKLSLGFMPIVTTVFAVVAYLYRFHLEAVLYAVGLSLLIAVVFIGLHFYCFYRRHKQREHVRRNLLTAELPAPHNFTEAEFWQIVAELRETVKADRDAYINARTDYLDYYGMWLHQIKTPIAAMQLILQEADTEEHRALLQELFRIEQYAEMALWYLRMGTADLVIEPCDLDGVVKAAVRKYAPMFVRKKIKLEYVPTNQTALTDKKWLTFIVEQLLSNAVQYTEKGGVTVTVSDQSLSVADTGIGIAPEDIPRIFEKGYTGYNGRTHRKSTGIGLYLCKRAADRLSHKLTVVSEVGAGSTFTVDMHAYPLQVE